jgi:indolepyruvate ferredoxin oxidoreductase alpha subunit
LLKAGSKAPLLGNEAIALGALEAGIEVITGYPGTPSSEVLESVFAYLREGIGSATYAEWAVNEKVAFEVALGASMGGRRSLVTMKGPGMNIASDPIVSSAYCGVDAGLVVLVADDPGPITTQTEQDSRWFAHLAKLPMIEPSSPQEAKAFMKKAVRLSEAVGLPVIVRTTTRVNHAVGEVAIDSIREKASGMAFKKDPPRYVRASMAWNRLRHSWLTEQLAKAPVAARDLQLDEAVYMSGSIDVGIITAGSAYNFVMDALEELEAKCDVLKIGLLSPLDADCVRAFLKDKKRVLIVEEIDPFLEKEVNNIAHSSRLEARIAGRAEGPFPPVGELDPLLVKDVVAGFLGITTASHTAEAVSLPTRPPPMCPGCPHMGSYFGIIRGIAKAGLRKDEVPIFGDIGCYALALNPPFEAIWTEHSMGASISMAAGLRASGYAKPILSVIGDSTFYHSGIPPLIEAVGKRLDMVVMILDNSTVAMTGHQSTPESEVTESGRSTRPVSIMRVVESLGVDSLSTVHAFDTKKLTEAVRKAVTSKGINVIIVEGPCAVLATRQEVNRRYRVESDKCTACDVCIDLLGCPALTFSDGKVSVNEEDCVGCGLCAGVCPYRAITEAESA